MEGSTSRFQIFRHTRHSVYLASLLLCANKKQKKRQINFLPSKDADLRNEPFHWKIWNFIIYKKKKLRQVVASLYDMCPGQLPHSLLINCTKIQNPVNTHSQYFTIFNTTECQCNHCRSVFSFNPNKALIHFTGSYSTLLRCLTSHT